MSDFKYSKQKKVSWSHYDETVSCHISWLVCIMAAAGKVNLYRLFCQVQTSDDEFIFLMEKRLIPKSLPCKKCQTEMSKIYPLSKPSAKLRYYMCPCSPREKTPLTRDTLLYGAITSTKIYIVLLYGFAYRFKYEDVRWEADVEGPDTPGQPGYINKILTNKTIAHWWQMMRVCIGQDMADRESGHKIGGVGLEVEIDESRWGEVWPRKPLPTQTVLGPWWKVPPDRRMFPRNLS